MTISSKNVPPANSGYPVLNGDRVLWKFHAEREAELLKDAFEDFRTWVLENGGPKLQYNCIPHWQKFSPFLNMYNYPEELAYTSFRPDPPNWYRFDSFMRLETETFEIPPELKLLPGKLVYFTMGTVCSFDLNLFKRLIGIMANSPNRFIVSKGKLIIIHIWQQITRF